MEDSLQAACTLWDELDQFPTADTDALAYLSQALVRLLDAGDVKWLAAVRVLQGAKAKADPLHGWRLRANYQFGSPSLDYRKRNAWWYQRNNRPPVEAEIGLATKGLIAGTGKFRAHRMRDGWIPFDEFRRSEHFRYHYEAYGITDRMWISFPLNPNAESMFLIDRINSKRHFTQVDVDRAAFILRGIRWFHRRLFLNQGLLIGDAPLSPIARQVVQKLLTGMTEKEVAESMGHAVGTTRTYVKAIYQQFGVNSRAALMALWLGNNKG